MSEVAPLTALIHLARGGDEAALQQLFTAAYQDLRGLAHARLARGGRDALLDTTALVHESYMRFAAAGRLQIEDRQHFFRYAAHVMRSVVVDIVRQGMSERRGGGVAHVMLETGVGDNPAGEEEIIRVHDALEELAAIDPRLVHVVEMRYFAGMTEGEIATALGITDRTVRRDWEKARLLLFEALR